MHHAFAAFVLTAAAALPVQQDPPGPRPAPALDPNTLELHGTVRAATRQLVKARVDGHVARVHVAAGATVTALQPLVTLSAPELLGGLGAAETRILVAEQHVQVLAVREQQAALQVTAAERRVQVANARVELCNEQLALAEQHAGTVAEQTQSGRVTVTEAAAARVQALQARLAQQDAAAAAAAAADEVELLRLRREEARLCVAEARTRIGVLRGECETVRARIGLLEVKSLLPEARVAGIRVTPGEVVTAGETVLLELVDDRRVRVELAVPFALARRVAPGAKVALRGPGSDADTAATVGFVEPFAGGAGFVVAVCELDNGERAWHEGSLVTARVELGP